MTDRFDAVWGLGFEVYCRGQRFRLIQGPSDFEQGFGVYHRIIFCFKLPGILRGLR